MTIQEELLAKLSPHRTHESNWFKTLLCKLRLHRWYEPDLSSLDVKQRIRFCPLVSWGKDAAVLMLPQ
jgi:hypothetical protein